MFMDAQATVARESEVVLELQTKGPIAELCNEITDLRCVVSDTIAQLQNAEKSIALRQALVLVLQWAAADPSFKKDALSRLNNL
jgi:hypothetical protein